VISLQLTEPALPEGFSKVWECTYVNILTALSSRVFWDLYTNL
jgi:hypothetical protein